jgi:eukaryotic-like serine/threonine-protein kinase
MKPMSAKHKRLKEFLAEAAAKATPAARADYLTAACQGDDALRREVEALLAANERAGSFLEAPALVQPTVAVTSPITEKPGDRIGPYRLLQQIGEGGCGIVYMAEQEQPIRRRVALKLIKLGMDTKQVIARFEAERQALALMDHPNIAKVLDAGSTDSGRPYFVMELVRGIRLTDYCDENHLSTAERLQLFLQICHAIQHAHQKGIIHRDIKPSNILVTLNDGVPVPKVIDFGIAKATEQRLTDKTLFTAFEQFIGTPAYMSPEQAAMTSLDIDTRSDVYALGVLLYELLTGHTPFDQNELIAAGLEEMRRIIREQEPRRPSTRLSALEAAEQTTVAQRRHAAAPQLIHIVRGDLDWIVMRCLEKDRTRRYETANCLADDLQRHLANEPVVARPPSRLYRLQKLVQRLARGRATYHQASTAQRRAQAEADKRQQLAQFLKDTLQGLGPRSTAGLDAKSRRQIADKAARRLDECLANQPETQAEIRGALGRVYFELGDYPKAEEFHRDALARNRKRQGNENREVLDALHNLGRAVWMQGKLTEAATVHREALAISKKLLGGDDLLTARSLHDLATVLYWQGASANAETLVREALAIRRKLLRGPQEEIASSLSLLAATLARRGELVEAEVPLRESLAMRRLVFGNQHPDVALSLFRLGELLAKQGQLSASEAMFYESTTITRASLDTGHRQFLMSLCSLANILYQQGKHAESDPYFREAAELLHEQAELGDAYAQNGYAWFLATSHHPGVRDGAAAVTQAKRAVAASERKDPYFLDTLGAAYAEAGEFVKAVGAIKEAMALVPNGELKQGFLSRIRLYESHTPYRDPCFQ